MSGSTFGGLARIALPIIGAALVPGAPFIGAAIGSLVGGLLFPPKVPAEPIAADPQATNSTEGAALTEFFGSCATGGNVLWDGGRRVKTKKKKVGGILGVGGTTVKTRKYYRTYAIGLGKEIGGLRRAWRNNLLVYDRRPQQDGESDSDFDKRLAASDELDEKMTVYLGTTDQLPDPTMEAKLGVGNAPAYRKRSYVVFDDIEETERKGAMSSWKFEVVKQGYIYTPETELAADELPTWLSGTEDPRRVRAPVSWSYEYQRPGSSTWYSSFGAAVAAAEAALGYSLDPTVLSWSKGTSDIERQTVSPYFDVDPGENEILSLHVNRYTPVEFYGTLPDASNNCGAVFAAGFVPGATPDFYWTGFDANGTRLDIFSGVYRLSEGTPSGYTPPLLVGASTVNNCIIYGSGGDGVFPSITGNADILLPVRRVPSPPLPESGTEDWPVNPDEYTWDPDTGQIFSKAPFVSVDGDYLWLSTYEVATGTPSTVIRYPLGPVLHVDDPLNTPAFWADARNAAVLAGNGSLMGGTYQTDGLGDKDTYPRYMNRAWARTLTQVTIPDTDGDSLGNIVRRCSELADLTPAQIDVTDLTEIVRGFQLDTVRTARQAIDTLRQFGFFDVVPSGNQIKYPTRGKDAVGTLALTDLGAHPYGETEPDKIRAEYVNDQELPKVVRVSYINQDGEYQRGQQLRGRTVTGSTDILDVQIPVVMDAAKAAQIGEVALTEPWIGRETYTAMVGPDWLALEPADALFIPLRDQVQRAIVSKITGAPGGVQTLELRRDDFSFYAPVVEGVPSGVGNGTPLEPVGDTTLVLIDGPALASDSNDAGVYLAAHGEGARWTGYTLLQSLDGGGEYDEISDIEGASTIGAITAALAVGPYELWDYANSLEVTLEAGTLESVSEASVAGGANLAWVGHPDRGWELLGFADATLTGTDGEGRSIYTVSTLLRGRLGTEWTIGTSEAGDYFVLAETCERLGMETSAIGVPRLLKAVSFGRLEESAPTQTFTPAGVALECYAPTLPQGQRDGSDNLAIYATRRARISGEWNDSDFVPLNEETEAYEIDVLDGVTVVRTLTGSSFPITYSAADQLTDFGSVQASVDVVIYQLSATVGRGYPCEATL